jgi:hypothetical protein
MTGDLAKEAEARAAELLAQLSKQAPSFICYPWRFEEVGGLKATKAILDADPATQIFVIRQTAQAMCARRTREAEPEGKRGAKLNAYAGAVVTIRLLRKKLPFTEDDYAFLSACIGRLPGEEVFGHPFLPQLVRLITQYVEQNGVSQTMEEALGRLSKALGRVGNAPQRKMQAQVDRLRAGPKQVQLEPGEAWSDAALQDLDRMPAKRPRGASLRSSGFRPPRSFSRQCARTVSKKACSRGFRRSISRARRSSSAGPDGCPTRT